VQNAVIRIITFTWVASLAALDLTTTGLPANAVANLTLVACTAPGVCPGPSSSGVAPSTRYLAPGIWRLLLVQYVLTSGLLRDTYAGVLPQLEVTLLAGQALPQALLYYLLYRASFHSSTAVVGADPWGHHPFIVMWAAALLQVRRQYPPPAPASPGAIPRTNHEPVQITITAPAPWVTVTGTLNPDGSIVATGTGTVAGFPNVPVRFTGTLAADGTITGQYRMGQDTVPTGLPNGSITYNISGTAVTPP
jgi:hypothetical protein